MDYFNCLTVTPEKAKELSPDLPAWFNPVWMQAVGGLYSITPKVLIVTKNDNPVARLPFYEKCFLRFRQAYNPTLVYYTPVFFTLPERKNANRNQLLQYEIMLRMGEYLKRHYTKVLLSLTPEVWDIRGFTEEGLNAVPRYTYILNLKKQSEFFLGEAAKIRRGEREGYVFSAGKAPERMLELVYAMYERKKHPFPQDREGVLRLMKTGLDEGILEQYNILRDNEIVSSIAIINDREQTAYGWLMATEQEEMKKGASLILFKELFQALRERFMAFDLCGANSKGPSRLKAALGAELKLFFRIIK
ncbi:MAG TPA: GNAT family N-acetyltransferase [Candidatus Cloacimonadota bacterium]|nr:GNAT family N-acetyltransferase [Candidatus Cloacimonadota bacterium]